MQRPDEFSIKWGIWRYGEIMSRDICDEITATTKRRALERFKKACEPEFLPALRMGYVVWFASLYKNGKQIETIKPWGVFL